MENLKLIDNDLVPVYETDSGEKVVNGRELYEVLQSKQDFSTWVKSRISECDAAENVDYEVFHKKMENLKGGRPQKEYIIKLDTAKEMAMLERNDIGKSVRKYFIKIEERYKEQVIDKNQLSSQLQLMNMLVENMNKQELEQKRQAEKLQQLEEKAQEQEEAIQMVKDTFSKDTGKDFRTWVNNCITAIAESDNYQFLGSRDSKYKAVRGESYIRLKEKKNCRLDERVAKAKGRALNEKPSITKKELESINKLSVIADDKALKPIYETVIKEMMLYYCVELKGGAV